MFPPGKRSLGTQQGSWLSDTGLRLSEWFEHWFPDAFSLASVAVVVVFGATLLVGSSPMESAQWFGAGFWDLVAFTMQMALIILTGYAVATSAPVFAIIQRLAKIPKTGRSAAAFVGLFSMLSSLLSWSFSLIFSALLAREVTHRVRGADYRAVGAAAYLGIGSIWALGLSSSAALIMAARHRCHRRFYKSAASFRSARRSVCGRAWQSRSFSPGSGTPERRCRGGRRRGGVPREDVRERERVGDSVERATPRMSQIDARTNDRTRFAAVVTIETSATSRCLARAIRNWVRT